MKTTWLVSGGAGFIGSNFVRTTLKTLPQVHLVVLDKLTYAGRLESLAGLEPYGKRYSFVQGDICNATLVDSLFSTHSPAVVVHFAAESHVDRSIADPRAFIETNVTGTYTLLEASRRAWQNDNRGQRFLHVSTDEVYGSLQPGDPAFSEETPYAPNSPYAASKAASDHLVRAYHHTYGLPTLTTNCSNNYGPYQFPEKLIPLTLLNALAGKPLPVYGDGQNVRDWLYVEDHCEAIRQVLEGGRVGQTYNIGGECEKTNMEVVETLCTILDGLFPDKAPHSSLITFVSDRPGHDRRYAIDAAKLKRELGFSPSQSFQGGLEQTVRWYLDHMKWVEAVSDSEHASWIAQNYTARKAVHP